MSKEQQDVLINTIEDLIKHNRIKDAIQIYVENIEFKQTEFFNIKEETKDFLTFMKEKTAPYNQEGEEKFIIKSLQGYRAENQLCKDHHSSSTETSEEEYTPPSSILNQHYNTPPPTPFNKEEKLCCIVM